MKNRDSYYRVCAFMIAASLALGSSAHANDRHIAIKISESQIQALGIQTMPLHSGSESVKITFPAQVVVPVGAEQVVSSPLPGLISRLLVQQFQSVKAGAPLVRIVSPELGQLQLQLLHSTSRAALARQSAQREQQLFSEGITPQRRLQEAQATLKEAEAALVQAKAALRLAGMPAAIIERVASSGNPEDGITLNAAKAGIVTEISVKPGQRVDAVTALLQVAQTDSLGLDIQIPASESLSWPPGTKVEVVERGAFARIVSASPTVSASSQTTVLRGQLEGKTGALRPGELVTVALPAGTVQNGWTLPLSAIAYEGKQAYLFIRTQEGFVARAVTVIASAGQRVRVQGELKANDQAAISGVVTLKGAWLDEKGGR